MIDLDCLPCLTSDPGEFFSLDEETGALTTAKKLDRESELVTGGTIRLTVKVGPASGLLGRLCLVCHGLVCLVFSAA